MNRYGGEFQPKFKDVIIFTDKNSSTELLKNLNREFDIENENFGVIPNLYYSKVKAIERSYKCTVAENSECPVGKHRLR